MSAPASQAVLLAGLRKALASPEPCPLQGTGADPLFPGGAKGGELVKAATEQGLLTVEEIKTKVVNAKGKSSTKSVKVGRITDKGRALVLEADSPKAVLELLLPAVQKLAEARDRGPDLAVFRAEVEKAASKCVTAIDAAFAQLNTTLKSAFETMGRAVVEAAGGGGSHKALDAAPVLQTLQAVLLRVTQPPAAPAPGPIPTLPSSPHSGRGSAALSTPLSGDAARSAEVALPPTSTGPELRQQLREAYEEQCLYMEFRDRLVEIPRLYHEALRRLPGLTVEQFHHELEALSKEGKVELHKLNEVQKAKDPHLAIARDDRLYYYIIWE